MMEILSISLSYSFPHRTISSMTGRRAFPLADTAMTGLYGNEPATRAKTFFMTSVLYKNHFTKTTRQELTG